MHGASRSNSERVKPNVETIGRRFAAGPCRASLQGSFMSTNRTRGNAAACRRSEIRALVPPEMMHAFAALAASRGMTLSSLLRLTIGAVLESHAAPAAAQGVVKGRREQVSLGLFPGDLAHVSARAASRHMKLGTYLAALVHGHVRREPSLPVPELNVLKVTVAHLAALSRQLQSHGAAVSSGDLGSDLRDVASRVEAVRQQVADIVRANVKSWETDDV